MGSSSSKRLTPLNINGKMLKFVGNDKIVYEEEFHLKVLYYDESIKDDCHSIFVKLKDCDRNIEIYTYKSHIHYIQDLECTGHPSNKISPDSSGWYISNKN